MQENNQEVFKMKDNRYFLKIEEIEYINAGHAENITVYKMSISDTRNEDTHPDLCIKNSGFIIRDNKFAPDKIITEYCNWKNISKTTFDQINEVCMQEKNTIRNKIKSFLHLQKRFL